MKTPALHALLSVVLSAGLAACAARRVPPTAFQALDPTIGVGVTGPAQALLERLAADVDTPTRAAALEVLVRVSDQPAGGPFGVAASWDPEAWVQRAALSAFESRKHEPEVQQRLVELATRPGIDPYVGCRAAVLLDTPVADEVVEAVRGHWQRAPLWKGAPCAAADAGWGSPEAAKRIALAVEQGDLALDPSLVRTLSTIEVDGLDAAMVRGLDVADELVRPALTQALLARGDAAAFGALRDSLADPDPLVRMEAVVLLAAVDGPDTDHLLGRASSSRDTPEGQVAQLVLAARSGASFRVFEDAFAGDNRDVRRAAVRYGAEHVARAEASSASRTARKKLEKVLAKALVDPDPVLREEALKHTGALQMTGLAPVVDALLTDDEADDRVRIRAAEASVALRASST